MATKFKQNLDVTGNITLSGQVNAQGNVVLGDADSDSVTFSADVTSHIIPDLTATYDLGADGKAWRSVHTGNLIFEGSNVDGNETTFGVVNPTADRTINLPDSTGTVATEEWVNAQGFGAGAGGSINGLNDVDTATSAPTTGQVLKWDGNNWIPQNDTASSYTDASVDTHLNQSTATSNQVLSWSGSDYAWVANGQGSMSNVVEDTTPQLGGNLDINGKDIVSVSNIDIRLLPNGNGKVIFDGNGSTSGISVSDGLIEMRTGTGTVAQIDLYCEVNNAHKVTIKPPPHAEYSGNLTFQLPNSNGTNGQYLKTDGNGVTSWGTVSGGSTDLNSLSAGVINTQNDSIGFIDADDSNNSKKETVADFLTAIAGSGISVSAGQLTAGTANNPGGADTQVQFNDSSAFGGDSDFTYNKTTNTLTVVNLTATNITTTGSGSTTVTAGANIELNATNRVLVTDTVFRLASMTTTQRNAVASPVNGDMIYNSTTNQIESYENSAWGATAGSGGGSQNLFSTIASSGQNNIVADGTTDTLYIEAGTGINITTDQNTDTLTITAALAPDTVTYDMMQDTSATDVVLGRYSSGAGTVQELSMGTLRSIMGLEYFKTIAVSGQSDVVADSGLGDTLTLVAGSNITLTTDASTDSITIASSGGGGGISNVVDDTTPQLGGDLDTNGKTIAYTFNVGNNGASDYTFSDPGSIWFPTQANDPVLYLRRGEQYKFVVNASGHPFQIRTGSGGSAYNTGVTNNGAQVGTIIFKVPMSAPATLYYQCTIHGGMGNTINIV